MNKVHRGVRRQDVAPCPLPRVGNARNHEHAKAFPDPVDFNGSVVIEMREFAFGSGSLEMCDLHPGRSDPDRHAEWLARRSPNGPLRGAVKIEFNVDLGLRRHRTAIFYESDNFCGVSDQREFRSPLNQDSTIHFGSVRRKQDVDGRGRLDANLCVMYMSIRDDEGGGKPFAQVFNLASKRGRQQSSAFRVAQIRLTLKANLKCFVQFLP